MRLPSPYRPESDVLDTLLARLDGFDWGAASADGVRWIERARATQPSGFAMETLLREYPLSTAEGLALMRLAEAADSYIAADKARKDLVEAQNAADSLIHSTEKALAEHGDKVGADEKTAIETGLADRKTARDGTDPEDIRAKTNTLVQASMKLGEAMYAAQQGSGDAAAEGQPADDGVVDAEFEEVSDTDGDDKKSA